MSDRISITGPAKFVWVHKPIRAEWRAVRFATQLAMTVKGLEWLCGYFPGDSATKALSLIDHGMARLGVLDERCVVSRIGCQ